MFNSPFDGPGDFIEPFEAGQRPSRITAALSGEIGGTCNIVCGGLCIGTAVAIGGAAGLGTWFAIENKDAASEEFQAAADEFAESAADRIAEQFESSAQGMKACALNFVHKVESLEDVIQSFFGEMTETRDQADAIRNYAGDHAKIPIGLPRTGADDWGCAQVWDQSTAVERIDAAGNSGRQEDNINQAGQLITNMIGGAFDNAWEPTEMPPESGILDGSTASSAIEALARNGGYFAPYWVYKVGGTSIDNASEQFYLRNVLNYYITLLIGQVRLATLMKATMGGNYGDSFHADNFKELIKMAGYRDSYLFSMLEKGVYAPSSMHHADETHITSYVSEETGFRESHYDNNEDLFEAFAESWEDVFPYTEWSNDERSAFLSDMNARLPQNDTFMPSTGPRFTQILFISLWTGVPEMGDRWSHSSGASALGMLWDPEGSAPAIYQRIKDLAARLNDKERYRMTIITRLIDTIKAEASGMMDNLLCVQRQWAAYEDMFDDLEDEWDDLVDEHEVEGVSSIFSGPWDSDVATEESAIDAMFENMESDMIDEAIEMNYRNNPERYFFKEQCYLLTHIFFLAQQKKDVFDFSNMYNTGDGRLVNGRSTGCNPATNAFGCPEPAPGSPESVPVTTSKKLLPYVGYTGDNAANWGPEQYNATLLLDGDPYAFVNKLVLSENLGPLVDIPHSTLSLLHPFVRLFKVEFNDEGVERDVEITFDAFRSQFEKELFTTRSMRNTGVGLKDFQFTYDGSNPFSAKKSIKAQLRMFANSFDELLVTRGSGQNTYRYVDLAIKTFNTNSERYQDLRRVNEEMAKLNFRLKAQVGWSVPTEGKNILKLSREKENALRTALYDSIITLNLTPTVHDFEIDSLGRVNFNIKYLAFVEDALDQAKFNVFSNAGNATARIKRNLRLEHYREVCESEDVRDIKKAFTVMASEEVTDSLSELISKMMDLDRIYYIRLNHEEIKDFVSEGPFSPAATDNPPEISDSDNYDAATAEAIEESLQVYRDVVMEENDRELGNEEERAISTALYSMDPEDQIVSYFYFSDLVDTILRNVDLEMESIPSGISALGSSAAYSREDIDDLVAEYEDYGKIFKKLRYLLGPVEFVNPNEEQESAFVNLGDIPISVKYFFEWLTSTMVKKQDSYFSLSSFMNQFVNNLVRHFLNDSRCFEYNIKQRVRLQQIPFTGPQEITYRGEEDAAGMVHDPITVAYAANHIRRGAIENRDIWAQPDGTDAYPLLRDTGLNGIAKIEGIDEVNYMIYFVGQTRPSEPPDSVNRREFDEERGIYHYQIGRDRGLVKDIKLKKTSTPGLAEVRFEQQGYDGLEQLRVTYDATIESYSNANTFPGTYIYIDPFGWSPSATTAYGDEFNLTKYGLGGYYMIIRSTHKFAPGIANSSIEAKWVNALDDDAERMSRDAAGAEDRKRDCSAEVERYQDQAGIEEPEEPAEAETAEVGGVWGLLLDD